MKLFAILTGCCLLMPFLLAAQTKSAAAPPRKKANSSKTVPSSSVPAKSVTKSTPQNTPATGRSNSDRLPASVPVNTPPPSTQPAPPRQQYVSRGNATRSVALAYHKGDNLLNIGVGLSSYYNGNPVGVSFEAGVDRDISVGGQFDYNSGNYYDGYYYSYRWGYRAMYLGARGSYHFNRILQINTRSVDLYAGLGLGYRSFRWNDGSYGYGYDYASGLTLNGFIGGRFYFSKNFGGFLEAGYTGLSTARIGLSARF